MYANKLSQISDFFEHGQPGVDVMIINFLRVFGENIGVFQENQCYGQFFWLN
jgi:hypothetical protein